ncbi:MAG: TetR family transcriptional regulator [Sphingomonadales bacterium]|nr:TetR family transcriptional regulator [Sphingomonadales bacterium]
MQTRSRLIQAARSRFGSVGYAATSMDELSASVGLTRGALYHQFGGKDGLLRAVVAQVDDEIAARLTQLVSGHESRWQRFYLGCRGFLEMALEPEIQRIVLRDAPAVLGSADRAMHSTCHADMANNLLSLMQEGVIRPSDPHALTTLLSGALSQAALWIASSTEPAQSLAQALDALDALLSGLLKDAGPLGAEVSPAALLDSAAA